MQTVIFDFDGVIIDSSIDISNAANHALEVYGFRRLPNTKIIGFVGLGAKKLLRLCFAESAGVEHDANLSALDLDLDSDLDLDQIYKTYFDFYMTHCADESTIYAGVVETLKQLTRRGVACAIVTNKPEQLTKKICSVFDIEKYFERIIGPESLSKMKPDPEGINKILEGKSGDAMMVGDSDTDIQAGRNAGIMTCGVTYGLGDLEKLRKEKPDYLVDNLAEILRFV